MPHSADEQLIQRKARGEEEPTIEGSMLSRACEVEATTSKPSGPGETASWARAGLQGRDEMTILFVSHLRLHPTYWGAEKRVSQLVNWLLSEGYRVMYLHYGDEPLPSEDCRKLPHDLVYIEAATSAHRFLHLAADAIRTVVRRLIPFVPRHVVTDPKKLWHAELGPELSRVVAQYEPDIAILEYLWTTLAADFLPPRTLKIVDTHDVFSRKRQLYDAGIDPFFYCSESVERDWLLRSDVIMAIQEEEAGWFRKLVPERAVITARHPGEIVSAPSSGAEPTLLFVGSAWAANVHGITQFAEQCWPKVLAQRPAARLRLVGNVALTAGKAIPSCDHVGTVPDLACEYRRAMIVINPVSFGTGLKIKSVEALCQGKVLVSTSNGVMGIPREGEEAFVVADDWDSMASRICELITDETARRNIATAALDLAKKHFSAGAAFRELKAILESRKESCSGRFADAKDKKAIVG